MIDIIFNFYIILHLHIFIFPHLHIVYLTFMYRYTVALFIPLVLFSCSDKKNEVTPVYKKITEAVYASGNIYPKNDYQVFANADGFLVDLMVSEGSVVMQGDQLFRIESDIQD